MAYLRMYDRAGAGLDMSGLKQGRGFFDTSGPAPTFLGETPYDFDTSILSYQSNVAGKMEYFNVFARLEGANHVVIESVYYFDRNFKSLIDWYDAQIYIRIDDLLSGTSKWIFDGFWGNDTIIGNRFADDARGGIGHDLLNGKGGHDHLFGEAGFDTLIGGSGNDKLVGGGGGDKLNGGGGNDELIAGSGHDVLRSGSGSDVFIFSRMAGVDIIKDFSNGRDKIEITDGARSYRDLDVSKSKGDVLVEFAGTEVIIEDVALRSITTSDFLFT